MSDLSFLTGIAGMEKTLSAWHIQYTINETLCMNHIQHATDVEEAAAKGIPYYTTFLS